MAFKSGHRTNDFADRVSSHPLRYSVEINECGLILGAGTQLARMRLHHLSRGVLAIEQDEKRLLTLLSVIARKFQTPDILSPIKQSAEDWKQGRPALANIRLAQCQLPRLHDVEDAYRLFLAEDLLDRGISPSALLKELGLASHEFPFSKYDPKQTRVPAGNGRESGRWGPGGGTPEITIHGSSSREKANEGRSFQGPPPPAPKSSFLTRLSPTALRALGAFALRFSIPTAVLGALIIPSPNTGGVTEGTLPDAPDVGFQKDGPAGTLRLTAKAADGSDIVVAAQNRGGAYVDVKTGATIGHDFGEQFVLDVDAVQHAVRSNLGEGQEPASDARSGAKEDEPKLCPVPAQDTPHGSGEPALDYEDDVHARVNPLAPLPRKFGVNMKDPLTGRTVFFDDCFRYSGDLVDGDMQRGDFVEAKGRGYEWRLRATGEIKDKAERELVDQAEKELRTAQSIGRGLKWYFAEPYAAEEARKLFYDEGLKEINIAVMLPSKRK